MEFKPLAIVAVKDILGYAYIELNGDMYKITEFDDEEIDTVVLSVVPVKNDLHNPFMSTLKHKEARIIIFEPINS